MRHIQIKDAIILNTMQSSQYGGIKSLINSTPLLIILCLFRESTP